MTTEDYNREVMKARRVRKEALQDLVIGRRKWWRRLWVDATRKQWRIESRYHQRIIDLWGEYDLTQKAEREQMNH